MQHDDSLVLHLLTLSTVTLLMIKNWQSQEDAEYEYISIKLKVLLKVLLQ